MNFEAKDTLNFYYIGTLLKNSLEDPSILGNLTMIDTIMTWPDALETLSLDVLEELFRVVGSSIDRESISTYGRLSYSIKKNVESDAEFALYYIECAIAIKEAAN